MKIINNKTCLICAVYTLLFILCFSAKTMWGEPALGESKTEGVISGVAITEKILTQLKSIPKVWGSDDYRIEKIKGVSDPVISIRKWWAKEDDQLEVTMVVCPTPATAKKWLDSKYKNNTNQRASMIEPSAACELELVNKPDICFVNEKEGTYSGIDFTCKNVVIMMRADGRLRLQLGKMAGTVAGLLTAKESVSEYSKLEEIPRFTLECKQSSIKLGNRLPLTLKFENKNSQKLRIFWQLTGGGIEENPDGNLLFYYYAGNPGIQRIEVIVVNELGLFHSASRNIEVGQ